MKKIIWVAAICTVLVNTACKKNKTDDTPEPEKQKKAIVTTIAGTGDPSFLDGPALEAKFYRPWDIAVQSNGTLYVTDFGNYRIRKISATGMVSTFAGNGENGTANGNGSAARFIEVSMIALDAAGSAYVLDGSNPRVRKITTNADVSVYAGSGIYGFADGPAATAQFKQGWGMLVDLQGNVIVSDTYNDRIRKINTSGQVTTLAGSGIPGYADGNTLVAQFDKPEGIAIDKQGNLYVADRKNYRIRKITPAGLVSSFAGSGTEGTLDGSALVAQFFDINDMVADSKGNLYVTDVHRIRKITPAGEVSTLAGKSTGFADGEGVSAKFNTPTGLAIDAAGNIYVADFGNNRIRKISFE
jgi:NHL repeat